MSLDLPPFRPRFPWWGADLQTVANYLRPPCRISRPHGRAPAGRFARRDRRQACSARWISRWRREQVRLYDPDPRADRIAGESFYIYSLARRLLDAGSTRAAAQPARRRPIASDLRGPIRCRSQSGFPRAAGEPAFRADAGWRRRLQAIRWVVRCCSNISAKWAAPHRSAAAATICAPIDLSATCRRMMSARNAFYHRHILGMMKIEATAPGQPSPRRSGRPSWDHARCGTTTRFLSHPVTVLPGRRTTTNAASRFVSWAASGCRRSCWGALDDPWIPGALYSGYDWAGNAALTPLLPAQGGHVGFHGAAQPSALERRGHHEVFRTWVRPNQWR